MNDISIGAVGAAIIAGLVSILGLIIGKEQKVSEFRQAWIDKLREYIASYLVHINAIADQLKLKGAGQPHDDKAIADSYKLLNEASHGITLRVNDEESEAIDLLAAMKNFEDIAKSNSTLTDANIKPLETAYIEASKALLKAEWIRVKRGENTYVWTKRIVLGAVAVLVVIFALLWLTAEKKPKADVPATPGFVIDNRSQVVSEREGRLAATAKPLCSRHSNGEAGKASPPRLPRQRRSRPISSPICRPPGGDLNEAAATSRLEELPISQSALNK